MVRKLRVLCFMISKLACEVSFHHGFAVFGKIVFQPFELTSLIWEIVA